ncbi:MAG: 16S rRNA (cytosine(1402)-N(4))-methyltransferase RsmH [Phycisphaerae bacterium]|nr:16S rRNA (cytosine(1402)-N(4))-methyltransferase RsmH [Phycisphaerae bacterium]
MVNPRHIPVLLEEVRQALDPRPGEAALDCTAGLGGHALELARRIGSAGTMVLNDFDPANLARAAEAVGALQDAPKVIALQGNFADAPRRLSEMGLAADIVLADLGFSSNQMEDAARGLSFMREGPLDMRLDPSGPTTAADLVNTLSEAELGEILRDFGEENAWRRIAQKLVAERAEAPISTTGRFASIVREAIGRRPGPPGGGGGIDPATRSFQALRIAVNDELGNLRALLESVSRTAGMLRAASTRPGSVWLKPGARIGIISFHSLEDRQVKQVFGDLEHRGLAEQVSRRPIEADEAELRRNPRARSAKLRVVRLTVEKRDPEGRLV